MTDLRDGVAAAVRRTSVALGALLLSAACQSSTPELHPAIAREYASFIQRGELAAPRYCGRLVEVKLDPRKIADGAPAYYDRTTGVLVVRCDNPLSQRDTPSDRRTHCPPPEWGCGP